MKFVSFRHLRLLWQNFGFFGNVIITKINLFSSKAIFFCVIVNEKHWHHTGPTQYDVDIGE